MVIAMSRPTRHPTTGVFYIRKGVPEDLRAAVGKAELKASLKTRDCRTAKANALPVLARFEAIITAARKGNASAAPPLRVIDAIIGDWYRAETTKRPDDPGDVEYWDTVRDYFADMFAHDPHSGPEFQTDQWFLGKTTALLRSHGINPDKATLARAAERWAGAQFELAGTMMRRGEGDWSPDPNLSRFPALPPPVPATPAEAPVSLSGLLDAWKLTAVVKPRTVDETAYAVAALAAFLKHDDATRLTQRDLVGWRLAQKAAGRTNNTVNNRLSLIRQVLASGLSAGSLNGTNPADGIRLPKSQPEHPLPYTDDDAARILLAARKETTPGRRWAHWVMAFSGMRIGEVLQLIGNDVRQDGGIWLMSVNQDTAGKSVKTGQTRHVPVHPALIAEGFVTYASTIAKDAPVFPDKGLDRHGNRGGRGWNFVGKWVRTVVGITDTDKAPDHSWRHRIEDEMRAADVPEDVRDAITGHARKTVGRSYGVRGESLRRLYDSIAKIPVPPGVVLPVVET